MTKEEKIAQSSNGEIAEETETPEVIRAKLPFEESLPKMYECIRQTMGVTLEELTGRSRKDTIAFARFAFFQIVMHYYPTVSFKRMGKLVNRDRSTVAHARKAHSNLMETSVAYRFTYNMLFEAVKLVILVEEDSNW